MPSYEAYLGVGIDATGAQQGASQVDTALNKVVDGAKKTSRAIKEMQSQLQQAQNVMKSQQRQIGELSHALETHRVAIGQARKAVEMKQRQIDQIKQTMMQYETALKQTNQAVSAQTREIEKLKSALEQKNSALKKNKEELAKYTQQLNTAYTAAKIFVAAVGYLAVKEISSYTQALSNSRAMTNASAAEMQKLGVVTRELGASTVFSAAQVADASAELGKAGFSVNNIMTALPATLDLAAAATIGMAEASKITANVMAGFGLSASEVGEAADVLAAIATSSTTDISGLGEAMKYAGPISKNLGITLQTTAAAMAVLAQNGLAGGQAGRNYRGMLISLLSPSKEAQKAILSLGLSVEGVNPQFESFENVVKKFAAAGLDATRAAEIFGAEGVNAILALTGNIPAFKQMIDLANKAGGTAKRIAEIKLDNIAGDFEKLTGAMSETAMVMGAAGVEGSLRELLQAGTSAVDWLNKTAEAFLKNKEQAAFLGEAITALSFTIAGMLALKAIMWLGGLATALYAAATAAIAMKAALFGVTGAGIGLLAYLVKLQVETDNLESYTRNQEAALLDMGGAYGDAARRGEIAMLQLQKATLRTTAEINKEIGNLMQGAQGRQAAENSRFPNGKPAGYDDFGSASQMAGSADSYKLQALTAEKRKIEELDKAISALTNKKIVLNATSNKAYREAERAMNVIAGAAGGFVQGKSPIDLPAASRAGGGVGAGAGKTAKADKSFFAAMGGNASGSSEYEDTSKLFWKSGDIVSSTIRNLDKYKEKNIQVIESLQMANEQESIRNDLLKKYGGDVQKVNQDLAIAAEVKKLNAFATNEEKDAIRDAIVGTNQLTEANKKLADNAAKAKDSQREWANSLTYAFKDAILNSKNLSDALSNLANRVQDMLLNKALDSLLGNFMGGFAKGAAFQAGGVTAFASGGIVGSPTTFAMRGGMGLMGEAGPEAIMPLTRTSSGDLGVRAVGSGTVINTSINVSVQGGSKEQNEDAGKRVSAAVKQAIDDSVISVILREKRPGGVLNAA